MNAKDILNNIFNKNCRIVVGNNHNHNHTKKYINNLNEELYKIECLGYIKKSDVINFKELKIGELNIID